ncbi:hypothetical protein ACFOLA_04525 [Salinicoccus hispanicus]|uniref:Uncharacterized protein n=1 Tax=Salinicoccus hispanicus TaxID=157225 RepID=A0A6N8U6W5_9STAP|nr:hypothetical protein [Salinicoccus hispanicus]MXQ52081.1 hypothetical protein [Salinicoccus hispanicus]
MKRGFVLLMVFGLAGCGYTGIMPETYDGEAFVKDEAAISAYEEDKLLKGDDIAERFPYVESSELAGTVDSSAGEQMTLEPGTYEAGEDLEPGRYTGVLVDTAGAIIIKDNAGVRIMEISIGMRTPDATFDLKPGYTLTFKSRDGELELSSVENDMMEPEETGSLMIPAGTHTAGTHIEPGTYMLASESLPIMGESGEHRIYWNTAGKYQNFDPLEGPDPELSVSVEINPGDTIVSDYYIELFQQ